MRPASGPIHGTFRANFDGATHSNGESMDHRINRANQVSRITRTARTARTRWMMALGAAIALSLGTTACAPEVGSDAWCEKLKETPKGDWSANDAANFAKQCVFK
jgi:hypothetical protein